MSKLARDTLATGSLIMRLTAIATDKCTTLGNFNLITFKVKGLYC